MHNNFAGYESANLTLINLIEQEYIKLAVDINFPLNILWFLLKNDKFSQIFQELVKGRLNSECFNEELWMSITLKCESFVYFRIFVWHPNEIFEKNTKMRETGFEP